MNYSYDPTEEVLICSFPEKVDANIANKIAQELKKKLDSLIGAEQNSESFRAVFDLSNTDYASSLFLRVVVMTANRLSKGKMEIKGASRFIRDLFKTSGLEQFIELSSSKTKEAKIYYPRINYEP